MILGDFTSFMTELISLTLTITAIVSHLVVDPRYTLLGEFLFGRYPLGLDAFRLGCVIPSISTHAATKEGIH